jgi:hypothetical protein
MIETALWLDNQLSVILTESFADRLLLLLNTGWFIFNLFLLLVTSCCCGQLLSYPTIYVISEHAASDQQHLYDPIYPGCQMNGRLLLYRFCLNTSWLHLTDIISRLNCQMVSILQIQINQQQHVTVTPFRYCLGPLVPGQYRLVGSTEIQCQCCQW